MHEIRYFIVLAEELNFTRAAERCSVSQPAMTRAIRKLETRLGALLFERRPSSVQLTDFGRNMLPRLKTGFDEIAAARDAAALIIGGQNTRLRLGVMCTAGPMHVVGLLPKLRSKIDDIGISLKEAKARAVVSMLMADEIDVAIAAWPKYPDEIEALPLFNERYVVAMPEKHVLASLETVPLQQLDGQAYIERLSCEFDEHFDAQVGEWPIELETQFSSEREDWIQEMITQGFGVAIVPEFMPLVQGLVKRPLSAPEIRRSVDLLTVRGRRHTRATEVFLRLARAHDWDFAV